MSSNHEILHKKLKKGSGNHNVLSYLMSQREPLSVAEARNLGLTNDLRSRISDLRNRFGVTGLQRKEVEGHTGVKYVVHWLRENGQDSTLSTLRVEIKVKNNNGEWFFGTYDKESNIVHYRDGRTQKVLLESYERGIENGVIVELKNG